MTSVLSRMFFTLLLGERTLVFCILCRTRFLFFAILWHGLYCRVILSMQRCHQEDLTVFLLFYWNNNTSFNKYFFISIYTFYLFICVFSFLHVFSFLSFLNFCSFHLFILIWEILILIFLFFLHFLITRSAQKYHMTFLDALRNFYQKCYY